MPTKEDFVIAYRKFPPSKKEIFFMKYVYFHNLHISPITEFLIIFIFFIPFFIEMFCYISGFSSIYRIIPTCIYVLLLFTLGIYLYFIWDKKKKRINKIIQYLNITKQEYYKLLKMYFCYTYSSTEEYIKSNCCKTVNKNNLKDDGV